MASVIQRFIVPWNIAIHGLSYSKMLTEKDIKAQLIAIIDSENLLPGYASCTELTRKWRFCRLLHKSEISVREESGLLVE